MDIKQQGLEKAIRILDGLQAQYKIIALDNEYGTLEVVPPKKPRTDYKCLGYLERLGAMQVGNVEHFLAPEDMDAEGYRRTISARATGYFGAETTMTTVDGQSVVVWRYA